MDFKKDFLETTRLAWQEYSQASLTLEDVREINYNLYGFFSLLDKWDKENTNKEKGGDEKKKPP